ncbi:hypothetical protein Tco_0167265 [Tanacetum coccineum]
MVACLEKSEGNADFHEIVDFLTASTVHYALTVSPTIYASYIEQFWNTAHSQTVNDVKQIHATVDGKTVVISESSVRSDLHFNDEDGLTCLTNDAIFENLALMGYESNSNKLTFQKALFSPQWKYLIHTILYCLSSKSTSWNEFSTNIASAVICLANGQMFNFSKLIFDGMLRNLDTNTKKFLIYPRFLQLFLNNQISLEEPFNDVYQTPAHTKKVFTNMKRKGKDFSGRVTPLFASMLAPPVVEGEGSGQPLNPNQHLLLLNPKLKNKSLKLVQVTDPGAKKLCGVSLLRLGLRGHLNIPMIHLSQEDSCLVTIKDCSRFGDQKAEKEGQKIRKKAKDKNSRNVEGDAETQGRNTAEQITTAGDTVNTTSIDVNAVGPSNVSTAEPSIGTARDIFKDKMMTIADTLVAIRSTIPRTTSVVIRDVEEEPRRATPVPTIQIQDKGKGKMVEPEPTLKNPIKTQIQMDAEIAQKLFEEEQAQFERDSKGLLGKKLQNKRPRMLH